MFIYVLLYILFIFKGVDINASIDGRLPIHYAADYGQKEVLNYLIDKGANIDVRLSFIVSNFMYVYINFWRLKALLVYIIASSQTLLFRSLGSCNFIADQ